MLIYTQILKEKLLSQVILQLCTMEEYEHPISPCQILKDSLELDETPLITRYFIDGGSKSGSEFSRINFIEVGL